MVPAPFVLELYRIVSDCPSIAGWSDGGNSFVIENPDAFIKEMNSNDYQSVFLELETYGFQQKPGFKWSHYCFTRESPSLGSVRKKIATGGEIIPDDGSKIPASHILLVNAMRHQVGKDGHKTLDGFVVEKAPEWVDIAWEKDRGKSDAHCKPRRNKIKKWIRESWKKSGPNGSIRRAWTKIGERYVEASDDVFDRTIDGMLNRVTKDQRPIKKRVSTSPSVSDVTAETQTFQGHPPVRNCRAAASNGRHADQQAYNSNPNIAGTTHSKSTNPSVSGVTIETPTAQGHLPVPNCRAAASNGRHADQQAYSDASSVGSSVSGFSIETPTAQGHLPVPNCRAVQQPYNSNPNIARGHKGKKSRVPRRKKQRAGGFSPQKCEETKFCQALNQLKEAMEKNDDEKFEAAMKTFSAQMGAGDLESSKDLDFQLLDDCIPLDSNDNSGLASSAKKPTEFSAMKPAAKPSVKEIGRPLITWPEDLEVDELSDNEIVLNRDEFDRLLPADETMCPLDQEI